MTFNQDSEFEGLSITTGSSIAALVDIAGTDGWVEALANAIFLDNEADIVGAEIINTGELLAAVTLADLGMNNWGSSASVEAVGIWIEGSDLVSSSLLTGGTIDALIDIRNVEGNSWADASGIYASGELDNSELVNTGDISASVLMRDVEGDAGAWSTGIWLDDEVYESSVRTGSTISAAIEFDGVEGDAGGEATGIYIYGCVDESEILNAGGISASVDFIDIGGEAGGIAHGIMLDCGLWDSVIDNSGTVVALINVEDTGVGEKLAATARGLKIAGRVEDSLILNSGDLVAEANVTGSEIGDSLGGRLDGMKFDGKVLESEITNSGNVVARLNVLDSEVGNRIQAYHVTGFKFDRIVEDSVIDISGSLVAEMNIALATVKRSGGAPHVIQSPQVQGMKFDSGTPWSTITVTGEVIADLNISQSEIGGNIHEVQVNAFKFDSGVPDAEIFNDGEISARFVISGSEVDGDIGASINGFHFDRGVPGSEIVNEGLVAALAAVTDSEVSGNMNLKVFGYRFDECLTDALLDNSGVVGVRVNLADVLTAAVVPADGEEELVPAALGTLEVAGIHVGEFEYDETGSEVVNTGLVDVEVTARGIDVEDGSFIVTGISAWGGDCGDDALIVNEGLIRLDIADLGTTDDLIAGTRTGAAVLFSDTLADFSAPGAGGLLRDRDIGGIWTSGNARALSLYNSAVTLQDGFGYTFHGDPDEIKRPIYLDLDSTLDLNDADLNVFIDIRGLVFDKPYYLVEVEEENDLEADSALDGMPTGVVGEWGDLVRKFVNPDVSVAWYVEENNGEENNGVELLVEENDNEVVIDPDNGSDAAVIFSFAPTESPGVTSAAAALAGIYVVQDQFMSVIRDANIRGGGFFGDVFSAAETPLLLASTGPMRGYGMPEPNPEKGFYALPYYTRVSDSGLGAKMSSLGILFGLEKQLDPVLGGLIFGYGRNNVDFTGIHAGNAEDQDVWTLGAYGVYEAPDDDWFATVVANYHHLRQDYSGWFGLVPETDKYTSHTTMVQGEAGYKIEDLAQGWGLYPAAGLRWSWWRTGSRVTSIGREYESYGKHYFHLLAGLDAARVWEQADESIFELLGGLKLEQAISSNEVSVAQTLGGVRSVTDQKIGSTSVIGNLAATWRWCRYKTKVGFMAQHNSDYNAYSGYAQVGLTW